MATRHASSRSPSPFSKSAHGSPQRPSKRTKGAPGGILASRRVFILQPKLSQTDISEILDLAESADADIVGSPDEADIIITKIGMRKRLERHIEWNLAVSVQVRALPLALPVSGFGGVRVLLFTAHEYFVDPMVTIVIHHRPLTNQPQRRRNLVTPDWLRDSVARGSALPCADYAALPVLRERDEKFNPRSTSDSRITSHYSSPAPPQAANTLADAIPPPAYLLPPPVPPPDVKLDHTAHFCCARASPLVCPNQPLCDALDVLKRGRALESNERSALSYSRAIAVSLHPWFCPAFIAFVLSQTVGLVGYQRYSRVHLMLGARRLTGSSAFPRKITAKERREVQKLPYIGAKVSKMVCGLAHDRIQYCIRSFTHIRQIDEYLFHGHIPEVGMCSVPFTLSECDPNRESA